MHYNYINLFTADQWNHVVLVVNVCSVYEENFALILYNTWTTSSEQFYKAVVFMIGHPTWAVMTYAADNAQIL